MSAEQIAKQLLHAFQVNHRDGRPASEFCGDKQTFELVKQQVNLSDADIAGAMNFLIQRKYLTRFIHGTDYVTFPSAAGIAFLDGVSHKTATPSAQSRSLLRSAFSLLQLFRVKLLKS